MTDHIRTRIPAILSAHKIGAGRIAYHLRWTFWLGEGTADHYLTGAAPTRDLPCALARRRTRWWPLHERVVADAVSSLPEVRKMVGWRDLLSADEDRPNAAVHEQAHPKASVEAPTGPSAESVSVTLAVWERAALYTWVVIGVIVVAV